MIKKIIILIAFLITVIGTASSQSEQLVINLSPSFRKGYLTFENPKGSIRVTGYDGTVVLVIGNTRYAGHDASVNDGMHRIGDNSLDISAEVNGNNILLLCKTTGKTVDFDIKLPRDFSLKLKSLDNGDVDVINTNGEVEVENNNGNITLQNIAGSAVLSSVTGDITAVFRKVAPGSPMMFTSFEGNISIALPDTTSARLKMKSENGDIMSDFDIRPARRESVVKKVNSSQVYSLEDWVTGTINGGGPEYIIRTYCGKVLIKKR
jgi:hypothetical protein